jgi:hypothetical protein
MKRTELISIIFLVKVENTTLSNNTREYNNSNNTIEPMATQREYQGPSAIPFSPHLSQSA